MNNAFALNAFEDIPEGYAVFKLIYNETKDSVIDTEYAYVNNQYCKIGKTTPDFFLGKRFTEIYEQAELKWFDYCLEADQEKKTINDIMYSPEIGHWLSFAVGPTSTPGYIAYTFTVVDHEHEEEVMNKQTSFTNNIVLRVSTILSSDQCYHEAMSNALKILSEAVQPDRLYILETDLKTISNTFEWCKDGITSEMDTLQNLSYDEYMLGWEAFLKHDTIVFIPDIEMLKEDYPSDYHILKRQGIYRLIAAPFYHKGKLAGYLGADNFEFSDLINTRIILEMASYFVGVRIANHHMIQKLHHLSQYDGLTGVHNRNALQQRIDELEKTKGSLGVVFADLNGLKAINDLYGHAAGDIALCEVASLLSKQFGNTNIYREGGDEFIVLLPLISKQDFLDAKKNIQRKINETKDYVIATGFAFTEDMSQINETIALADNKMYQDKAEYYRKHDRRKRS